MSQRNADDDAMGPSRPAGGDEVAELPSLAAATAASDENTPPSDATPAQRRDRGVENHPPRDDDDAPLPPAEIAAAQGDSVAEASFLLRAAQTSPMVVEYIEKALADSE